MVLRLKARESRSPPGLLDGCKKTHTPNTPKGRQTLHQRNHRALVTKRDPTLTRGGAAR